MSASITLGLLSQQLGPRITATSQAAAAAARELTEGKPADVGAATQGRFSLLLDRKADLERAEAYARNADTFTRRAEIKQNALTEVAAAAEELLLIATTQLPIDDGSGAAIDGSPVYNPAIFAQAADSVLERVLTAFNTSDGAGFVFAGVAADQPALLAPDQPGPGGLTPQQAIDAQVAAFPPIDAAGATALVAALDDVFSAAAVPPVPAEDFAQAFYAGAPAAGARVAVSVDEGVALDFGLQADDDAARALLQGVHMLASVDLETLDPAALPTYAEAAIERLAAGLDAVRVAQAELGGAQARAETASAARQAEISLMSEEVASLEEVDPFEAQIRYTQLETQLNLLFEIVARTSNLRLFNVLR